MSADQRREQLLELGLRLFTEQSYDEVSIARIATLAGISKGLLYHYFSDGKRGLYVAVVERAAERLSRAVRVDPALPPRERALTGLSAYLDFVEAHGSAFSALMHGGLGTDAQVQAIVQRTRQAIIDGIIEAIGLKRPRPAFRVATAAWVGAVEAASLDWIDHRDLSREDLLAILLPGLVALLGAAVALDPKAGVVLEPDLRALPA